MAGVRLVLAASMAVVRLWNGNNMVDPGCITAETLQKGHPTPGDHGRGWQILFSTCQSLTLIQKVA
ncbi:hypothetical protein A3860_18840 [Niastella vici]|uniref:Uncharacterized protein n=1 Tax=Niastella vici TaxID=1703345 RepID=A0A1V9G2N0_9BACT|nr:hypothetical protein A3860_18840 [Niastella vici]